MKINELVEGIISLLLFVCGMMIWGYCVFSTKFVPAEYFLAGFFMILTAVILAPMCSNSSKES